MCPQQSRTQNNRQNQSQQWQRGPRNNSHNGFPATNATNASQSTQETYPHNVNTTTHFSNLVESSKSLYGLSVEQLQQLAQTISIITPNHAFGNNNAYGNVAGLISSSNSSINFTFIKPWILDRRATDHISSDLTLSVKQNSHQYLLLIYLKGL